MHGVMRVGAGPLVGVVGAPELAAKNEPVQLAFFVDAGSRDAQTPETATLAAWLLAETVGRDARGRAFPDGIEVIAPCPDGLQACLKRLARGLALRAPTAAALTRATHALLREQRESLARDRGRASEALAVEALWPDSENFFPLARSANRAKPPKSYANDLRAFIADAFGPERALIVASGPVDTQQLAELTHDAFASAPHAKAKRAARDAPELRDDVAVGVDAEARLSVAVGALSVLVAAAAAEALRAELLRDPSVEQVSGHAMSVRGGALAVLRVALHGPSADTSSLVRRVGAWVARARREGLPESQPARMPSAPLEAMRYLGVRFAAGASDAHVRARDAAISQETDEDEDRVELHVGVGVLVPGGRADRVAAADPDAALRKAATERLRAVLREGQELALPELNGERDAQRADVTLENGSRILVRSTLQEDDPSSANASVAIAVTFARGAISDPPAQHGRAALLATLMATACAGRTPDALTAELAGMNARIEPFVRARTLGIALEAPASVGRQAIALAVECALSPSLERGHVTLARLRLRERLGHVAEIERVPHDSPEAHVLEGRAAVARTLSLQSAQSAELLGAVAPWGSAETLPSVDERALGELMAAALRGPSTTVAIAGAVPADLAALWAARRVSGLASTAAPIESPRRPAPALKAAGRTPEKTARRKAPQAAAADPAAPPALPPQAVEALVVWQTPIGGAETAHMDAARAFAAGTALALEGTGLHVPWLGGDCAGGTAWAAAVVRAPTDQLAKLGATLASTLKGLNGSDLARAAERAEAKRAGPSLIERAQTLADPGSSEALPAASKTASSTAQALIERLRAAPPLIVPTR